MTGVSIKPVRPRDPTGISRLRVQGHAVNATRVPTIPRWAALAAGLAVFLLAFPIIHGVLPWAISSLGHRYGWTQGHPALWNLSGLLPLLAGTIVLVWLLVLGLASGSELPERVALDWSPKLLLTRGPYAISRHPMYVAESGVWLGWAILFGNIPVLLGCLLVCVGVGILAPREEHALELRFGEVYRRYKAAVPRWPGQPPG
jgi:protein-S-isoprenylcysteine O-methyltransferase Ste14